MASKRKSQALGRSQITTEDGTVIITDPELGQSVSGRTLAEAEAELARRKAAAGKASSRPAAAGQIDEIDFRREGLSATPREGATGKEAA